MKQVGGKRPDAKRIIDTVAEAMRAGMERIDDEYVLVPSSYEVFLHAEAFQELEPIFPILRERAVVRLDRDLELLNQGGKMKWAKRFMQTGQTKYRRAGPSWEVQIYPTHDSAVEVDYIAVAAELVSAAAAAPVGPKTRRLTVRDTTGGFQTRLLEESDPEASSGSGASGGRMTMRMTPPAAREETVGQGTEPLARLSFTDDSGARTVVLTATETAVGRKDPEYDWVEVQLATVDDVSREHLRLRCNREAGCFEVKDVSSFGTTVTEADRPDSRRRVQPSIETETGNDLDRWEPIPDRAVLGLADTVYITFESLLHD